MTKLPSPSPAVSQHMVEQARKRYEACVRVHGARSGQTREAKRKLDIYTENAKARGHI